MARPESTALAPLLRAQMVGPAALWSKPTPALLLELVEAMHVLSLRHLPGSGTSALHTVMAAQALPVFPEAGRCFGIDPMLIWRSPSEILLLTQDPAQAATLLSALRPAPGAQACAHDLTPGSLVLKVQGTSVDAFLTRLVDAQAWPREIGQASRMRLADIAAVVWREAPDRVGMLVDQANGHYLARWLSYSANVA